MVLSASEPDRSDRAPTAAAVPFVARPPGRISADPVGARGASPEPAVRSDLGPLAPLLVDPDVTDVFVTGDGATWIDRGGGMERVPGGGLSPPVARELAVTLVSSGGRHVDEANPCADVRLAGGLRVHAVLPPVSNGGALISIRVARSVPLSLTALADAGFFARVDLATVRRLVDERRNLLVTGAGGSGKTTLLGALLSAADPRERIVVLEDVGELRIAHPHVVALEARQPNLEGAGGIGLDRLVREALRMRPDRLVVGEVRGAELRDLLSALNTGHDGGAGTLHANSIDDVPARLEALAVTAGLGVDALARQAVSALHAVLHVERTPSGRRLSAIGRLVLDPRDRLAVVPA